MYCPYCSKEIADDSLYCTFCGQHLFPGQPRTVPPPVPPPANGSTLGPLWSAPQEAPVSEGVAPEAPSQAAIPPPTTYAPAYRPAPAPKVVRYAGFWRRFLAYILDIVAISCVQGILTLLGILPELPAVPSPQQALKLYAVAIPCAWLYYALMEASPWQATLGKRALDLSVTDLAGIRVSFVRASGRFFGKLLSGIILGIGFLMAAFTEKKQALHDIISGCLVIRRNA
jgi:uncharacterized RDD family membrane protein YckC